MEINLKKSISIQEKWNAQKYKLIQIMYIKIIENLICFKDYATYN